MKDNPAKPVIFISYSHKDEPERSPEGEIHWLSELQTYLVSAIDGTYELWTDEQIEGGVDWEPVLTAKLAACNICILLVSRHSLASKFIIEFEIETIRKRQADGHDVSIYPIVLSPFPETAAPEFLLVPQLKPRLDKPLSGFSRHDRGVEISKMADEIARRLKSRHGARPATPAPRPPVLSYVHITGLPETAYERLVGRSDELKRLDEAWEDEKTNILSLIAEGGAGKSALVNEWLKRMQADNYRSAETVLGWSFYSQGTKERATSADAFLNWVLEKLEIKTDTKSANEKGDKIAEALMRRRVLLVLDGVEPLQHGPDGQIGQLKDQGLRALLRRFSAAPPGEAHGLIVLTSRLAVSDIAGRKDGAAPVVDIEKLSDEAGAALLRDNGVWGTDKELKQAAQDFGGHPLALGLLASFLKETQTGDARRRDHVGALVSDKDNPRHGHAKRVMASYEKDWLADQPVLLAIMQLVGLFDRPASGDCLKALRTEPAIAGLTDAIVILNEEAWQRAIARLRDVRLIAPPDPAVPGALDAHPLLREWFGTRLKETSDRAWRMAHGRLYEHLRDTTMEGQTPSLEQLTPLFQAIAHGCRAGWHQEALDDVYTERICKRDARDRIIFYSGKVLGASGSDLAAVSWFFDKPFETPVGTLRERDRSWILNEAAFTLRAMGRLAEALPTQHSALQLAENAKSWSPAASRASNLSETALLAGNVTDAVKSAETCVVHADRCRDKFKMMVNRTTLAAALHAAGKIAEATRLFADAEDRQREDDAQSPFLYSLRGYQFCDLQLVGGDYGAVRDRAIENLKASLRNNWLLDIALDILSLGRAHFGLAVTGLEPVAREASRSARAYLDEAVDGLRSAGHLDQVPRGPLARAAFRRCVGDGHGAARDLDEVEEVAEPGPMRLFLCDLALERARLAFAKIEAFAPLNGTIGDSPPKPEVPSEVERKSLHDEAAKQIAIAAKLIAECGYHRRDAELAELQSVLKGERTFASLPIHV